MWRGEQINTESQIVAIITSNSLAGAAARRELFDCGAARGVILTVRRGSVGARVVAQKLGSTEIRTTSDMLFSMASTMGGAECQSACDRLGQERATHDCSALVLIPPHAVLSANLGRALSRDCDDDET